MHNALNKLELTCLDVGARRGFVDDLRWIAPLVNAIGFEPDAAECTRLNSAAITRNTSWRSLKYLPTALGCYNGPQKLNLYRSRGCSSFLTADVEFAMRFARNDYYLLDAIVDVPVMPLDKAAEKFGFQNAVFMKIDVQGAEMDVFQSGPALLRESILGIRTEVCFMPLYKGQPLFADIDAFLRQFGFVPMRFIELHEWRRSTKLKYPKRTEGAVHFSRGQIIHGDILYLRQPEDINAGTEGNCEKLLKLALIAICYGLLDHARVALAGDRVADYLKANYRVQSSDIIAWANKLFGKKTKSDMLSKCYGMVKSYLLDVVVGRTVS